MSDLFDRALAKQWFYAYELPDGRVVPTSHDAEIRAIHDTRWSMIRSCLDRELPADRSQLEAIDIACHQGWFAVQLAQAGFARVVGVDARASHVADSSLMGEIYDLDHLSFQHAEVESPDLAAIGRFDVVLMLGLLYHLENPVGALRACRALCDKVCLIETQVIPGLSGYVDYGSYKYVQPLKGSFGIIDESAQTDGTEASTTGICLVPSLEGLQWILSAVGFSRVELLEPPADAYEQLRYHKRVMLAAFV